MRAPAHGDDWLALTTAPLPAGAAHDWAVHPEAGAVVLFSGTTRNHAPDRPNVEYLEYEAFEERTIPVFAEIAAEARRRWPAVRRVALIHRIGRVEVGESSVVVAVSAPHRPEAFAAARFAIDALKESAPIWKYEVWADGADWGTGARPVAHPRSVGSR